MKGIILAGGNGSRLHPLTKVVSKQLLPVYDKPMIYYPLSTLMNAQIREVLIITNGSHVESFRQLLGDGSQWGMSIEYKVQNSPNGVPEAFILGADFLETSTCALILGDNIFVGPGMGRGLVKHSELNGAHILLYPVQNPSDYGVAEVDSEGRVISLVEKPNNPASRLALTGLIFADQDASAIARNLKPSSRNELEITDFLNCYRSQEKLSASILDRGTAWMDMGQVKDLFAASEFVKVIEDRQGLKIAVPEEIAWRNGWIGVEHLESVASRCGNPQYREYLLGLGKFNEYD